MYFGTGGRAAFRKAGFAWRIFLYFGMGVGPRGPKSGVRFSFLGSVIRARNCFWSIMSHRVAEFAGTSKSPQVTLILPARSKFKFFWCDNVCFISKKVGDTVNSQKQRTRLDDHVPLQEQEKRLYYVSRDSKNTRSAIVLLRTHNLIPNAGIDSTTMMVHTV